MRITLAVVHLLGFSVGLGAVFARARALNRLGKTSDALQRAFVADNWWGISAIVLIGTGLWRAFGSFEKTASYYWTNHVFYAKMGLLVIVLALEIWPMVTLIRWRRAAGRSALPPAEELGRTGRRLARISDVQTLVVVGIVVAAVMLARGYGAR